MEVQKTEVDNILNHWKRDKSNLIEMLEDVQEHYRYIPPQVAITIAEELDISMNRIFHIATFYKGFTLEPRGKYPVSVCTGTACHVKGERESSRTLCVNSVWKGKDKQPRISFSAWNLCAV